MGEKRKFEDKFHLKRMKEELKKVRKRSFRKTDRWKSLAVR
jgi:hypothetical protein